jgi:hypothetical protein
MMPKGKGGRTPKPNNSHRVGNKQKSGTTNKKSGG